MEVKSPILIAGYICGDYCYEPDLDHFKKNFPNPNFLPNNISYNDRKVSVIDGTAHEFLKFLNNGVSKFIYRIKRNFRNFIFIKRSILI